MPRDENEYGKLDSLRAIAAFVVIAYHSCFFIWAPTETPLGLCQVVVDYFFMVSGFVMTHAYMRQIQEGMSFKVFAQLRLGRIFPLHIAMMGLLLVYTVIAHLVYSPPPDRVATATTFVTHLLLLNSFGLHDELYWNVPSWSLSAEIFAYGAFFLVCSTFDDKRRIVWPFLFSGLLYAFLLIRYPHDRMDLTFEAGAPRGIAGFFLGSALWRLRQRWPFLRELRGATLYVLEVVFVLGYLACLLSRGGRRDVAMLLVLNAAGILLFTTNRDGIVGRALRWKPGQTVGAWTYSMYLIHYPIICIVLDYLVLGPPHARAKLEKMGAVGLLANALLIGFVMLLAKVSFERIEEPARKWVRNRALGPRELRPAPAQPGSPQA